MNKDQQSKYTYGVALLVIFVIIFYAGNYHGEHEAAGSTLGIPADINITSDQFQPFWKVWDLISQKYVAATTTDSQQRIWGAIEGLAASQNDPYTVFFPPEQNSEFQSDISGNFDGVGMEIDVKDGVITVIAPVKGSPADKAGVKTGDQILKIDNTSTTNLPVDQAVDLIRGTKGTTVKILFARAGVAAPFERISSAIQSTFLPSKQK